MARSTTRIEFIQSLGNDTQVYFRLYEPTDVPNARKQEQIDCDVDQPPFADLAALAPGAPPAPAPLVRDVGEHLYGRLAAHPGVEAVLQRMVAAGPGDYCPVYLEITGEAAEALPFETLFVPGHHFLALNERTPIVRVATAHGSDTDVTERLYDPPLRIAAVISAAGRDRYEDREWSSLRSALTASPLPVKLQVFVGRRPLYDAIVGQNDVPDSGRRRTARHTKPPSAAKPGACPCSTCGQASSGSNDPPPPRMTPRGRTAASATPSCGCWLKPGLGSTRTPPRRCTRRSTRASRSSRPHYWLDATRPVFRRGR